VNKKDGDHGGAVLLQRGDLHTLPAKPHNTNTISHWENLIKWKSVANWGAVPKIFWE